MIRLPVGVIAFAILASASSAFAEGEFASRLACVNALSRYSRTDGMDVDVNAPGRPGSLDPVGYLVQGKNAGRDGFYMFRGSEAYFVAMPKDAVKYVDPQWPAMPPAFYLKAEIPKRGGAQGTDNVLFTIQDGKISSYTDDIGRAAMWNLAKPEEKKELSEMKKYTVTVRGADSIGPESRQALDSAILTGIESLPASLARTAKQRIADALARSRTNTVDAAGLKKETSNLIDKIMAEGTTPLNLCASVDNSEVKKAIEKAKGQIQKPDGVNSVPQSGTTVAQPSSTNRAI